MADDIHITHVKDFTVHFKDLKPQTVAGMLIVQSVLLARGIPVVISSVNDGQHMSGSLHYAGRAFDFRLPSRYTGSDRTNRDVQTELKQALGSDFDVVLESDHFHVEYDPKEGR